MSEIVTALTGKASSPFSIQKSAVPREKSPVTALKPRITPEGAPRRYDTRFFVARAPEDQEPLHDDHEVIANVWIRPQDALDRHRTGEFDLIFPTMRSRQTLARFDTADEVLEAAQAIEAVPAILPRIVEDHGGYRIVLPGDPEYDEIAPVSLPQGIPMNKLVSSPATEGA